MNYASNSKSFDTDNISEETSCSTLYDYSHYLNNDKIKQNKPNYGNKEIYNFSYRNPVVNKLWKHQINEENELETFCKVNQQQADKNNKIFENDSSKL